MSDDPEMEKNYVMVDPRARHNSNVDIEGYSLLPDIIWTPGPEMLNSQYGKVIFTNVKDSYSTNEDLLCMYTIMSGVEVRDDDRVAIFCVGWANITEVITWVLAAKHPWPNEELSVVFPACQLPAPSTHFYQFCYLSAGEVRGASVPFNFVNKPNVHAEDQQKALYLRNHRLIDKSAQINIVSSGDGCLHNAAAGQPENLTLSPSDRNSITVAGSSDEHLRLDPQESDASCSEVTSSEQYVPNTQNAKQENMTALPFTNMYKDHDTPAVASTSQGVNGAEIAVPACLSIPSGSRASMTAENVAQSTDINSDLQRNALEVEQERVMLFSTVNAFIEENATLRARLDCELEKNRILSQSLQRTEAEVERQMNQYDICRQNNKVVVKELENELDNQRLRIGELYNIIREKERTIAYFTQRFGPVNEHAIALGLLPQFPSYPGHADGQVEQEGHVGIEASSDIQRQDIRTSTATPFYAALRKTRNYYVTFLSDKADIERKVFALSCTKLSLVKKLHSMKERKELLKRLEYRYYTALQGLHGEQSDVTRGVLEAISEAAAEQRALDEKAFMEVDMIEEIKKRLEINRQNICTLRAKAIEVFNSFLETFNYSMEHYSGAAQAEVMNIHTLYAGLDKRFNDILCAIANCYNNTFVWD